MRLHSLYVDGFGHFHDYTVGPLDSNVTVLYGPNEAGKSTLLAFIRTVLFGFPTRGRDDYYPPIAGGKHGGRITLFDDDGTSYTVERFAGPHGGRYLLRAESGDLNVDPMALQRLTGHATPDLFRNVFAFSLDEIQNEGLMSDSEGAGRLYSAGMGASGLPDFIRNLANRKNELFRPRGSAQEIAKLLRDLSIVDGRLRTIQDQAQDYRNLMERQDVILRELRTVDDETSILNIRLAEIGRLQEGWNDWVALEELEARLREIAEFDGFPDSPIERLQDLENRLRQAREDKDEAQLEMRRISEAADFSVPDESLLDDVEHVEAIRRARNSFDSSVRDLPERRDELRGMEEALTDRTGELGDGWDEASLNELDTSLAVRRQVEEWRDRLNKSIGEARAADVRLKQNCEQLEELRAEQRQAEDMLLVDSGARAVGGPRPATGRLEDLLDDRAEVERVRRGRGSFDDSVGDLPERRAELNSQEADIARQLRDLGKSWDESRLDAFDTSMVFRQEVDDFRKKIVAQSDEVRRSTERLERAKADLIECRSAVEQVLTKAPLDPPLDAQKIELRKSALRTARSRLNDHDRASINLENLRAQLTSLTGGSESASSVPERRSIMLPALLGMMGLALGLAGAYMGQESLLLGIVAGVVLLGFSVYLRFRVSGPAGTAASPLVGAVAQNVSDAEAAVKRAVNLLTEAAQPLSLENAPTADVLDNAEAYLEAASSALSAFRLVEGQVEEAKLALKTQERRVEEAEGQVKSAGESETRTSGQWRQWLRQQGLVENLTPETVVGFIGRIETTRAFLQNVRHMRQRVAAIEVDIAEYHKLVRHLAEKYGIPFNEDNDQRVMAVADILIESLDSVRQLVTQRDSVLDRLTQHERSVTAADAEHRSALQDLEDRQSAWGRWLEERGLKDGFTPDALLEFLARAETAHASSTETLRMRNRVAAIEVDVDQFRGQVRPLTEIYGITLDVADPLQLALAADTLISKLEEVQKLVSEREQARQLEKQQRPRVEQLEKRFESAAVELAALLAAGAAADDEEFRRRAGLYAQRQEAEVQREERLRSLSHLSGPGERVAAFREALAAADPDRLSDDSRILTDQIRDLDNRRNELREERGRNSNEIERLAGEEESSALRIRRNVLMEQLRENAQEWSRLTIAGAILERTQKKFERERQPSVIRHAEEFFSNVTGRRYTRLYAPVGERTITVTDASGLDRRPSELSRGTREQLYLALRFGLIREFGEHAERLPVIVDEALVNFDPERASLAASSFAKLSDTNQVLVFTCHRTMADTFVDLGARLVEIGRSDA